MNNHTYARTRFHRFGPGLLLVLSAILVPALVVYGVTGYFRLSSDSAALRDSVREALPATCSTAAAINVGPMTLGLARLGLGMIPDLPPEARKAMRTVNGFEAGVYQLNRWLEPAVQGQIAAKARQAMERKGWTQIVRVTKGDDMVLVFMPDKNVSERNLRFNVLVIHEQQMVVASMRGNIQPVLEIISENLDLPDDFPLVVRR